MFAYLSFSLALSTLCLFLHRNAKQDSISLSLPQFFTSFFPSLCLSCRYTISNNIRSRNINNKLVLFQHYAIRARVSPNSLTKHNNSQFKLNNIISIVLLTSEIGFGFWNEFRVQIQSQTQILVYNRIRILFSTHIHIHIHIRVRIRIQTQTQIETETENCGK